MPAVVIRDEVTGQNGHHSVTLEFPTERMTVRELIRERVYQEVQDYNARKDGTFAGLVQPEGATAGKQRGYAVRPGKQIDWKAQFDRACEAFTANRILLLVGDHQATSLDEMVTLARGTEVTFLRLLPLVGG